MKSILALALALNLGSAVAQDKPMSETYKVDPAATKIAWEGKKVTGKHNGTINAKDGSVTMTGDLITAGEINVDMKTITVLDIPAGDEYNAKLKGHLSNADFFDVEKYPTSKLVITGSEKSGKNLKVKGNLTMIGQTKPIEFIAAVAKSGDTMNVKTDVVIDRTKWGLKYGSGDFFKGLGDKAINNEFTLSINLSAKK